MSQPNVFEQIIKHISRNEFEKAVKRHNGNFKVSKLDCWTWFGSLLFGQLTGHDSIRAIERVFSHSNKRMQRLGFSAVCRSTLSDANKVRPLEILDEIFHSVSQKAKLVCPKSHGFDFNGKILALDSTIIDLCLSLSPWANFRRGTAGVKLHMAIDLAGDLPDFFVITPAIRNDIPVARKEFNFSKGTTIIIDRGYWDCTWLRDLTKKGVFWVTRTRKNNRFRVKESRPTDRTQGYLCDQIVYQVPSKKAKKYKGKLRRISYRDQETKKKLTFLTNHFDLDTKTICKLYKARWNVELFFKALKQNLRVKKFLGTSAHAVKTQIYVALIAYLLVQIVRFNANSRISLPDAMAAIATLLLLREPLKRLLGDLPRNTRHPPSAQLLLPILK